VRGSGYRSDYGIEAGRVFGTMLPWIEAPDGSGVWHNTTIELCSHSMSSRVGTAARHVRRYSRSCCENVSSRRAVGSGHDVLIRRIGFNDVRVLAKKHMA